jgi:glutamate-1-semialdehyde 2,1-aminomutase
MRAFERRPFDSMETWEEELQAFRRRTRKSARAWEAAKKRIPFGVNSNYRLVEPYPLYIRKARGSRIWDADGHEYVDFNMAFGALVAGHSHPLLAKAMRERVSSGTIFGFESVDAGRLADVMCRRFHVDRLKFSMTGLDATLFAIRLARAVTGRRRILKFEGCYHGSHDALMVSIKPRKEVSGDPKRPLAVPSSKGLLKELVETAMVAPFNDLPATEALASEHADDIAGIILEPVPMNMGYVDPEPGFLEGLRAVADEIGALLIFDEVKTCGKWYGGAEETFGVAPDIKVFGKAIGGGFPLAAVGGKASIMDQVIPGQIAHAGTFNANPLSISAGLVTLTKILTRAGMNHAQRIGNDLAKGYADIIHDHRLPARVQSGGISGTVHFTRGPVTDWRSFQDVDVGRWWGYYTAMMNRGIIPMATGPDEQWTTSVAHTKADVARHLDAFEEVAESSKRGQAEMKLVEAV